MPARRCPLVAAVLSIGLRAGAGSAFVPPAADPQVLDLLRVEAPSLDPVPPALAAALEASPAWRSWARRHPGWRVTWNARTRTPHRAYGPGAVLEGGAPTAARIEAACRSFLAGTQAFTGIRAEELFLLKAERRLERWFVIFEQRHRGLPVLGGRADVRVGRRGEVVVWGADWHQAIVVDLVPTVPAAAATAVAASGLVPLEAPACRRVIVPEPRAETYAYHLAHEIRFRTQAPPGDWLVLVDAHTGQRLLRQNRLRHAEVSGRITAAVESTTVGDPQVSLPLRDTRFNIGSGATEFGFTDADGRFVVATAATDSVSVFTRLQARWGRVYNHQRGLVTPRIDARMLPGTSRDFAWGDSNSRASERDAYYHALRAHQYIKELDPAFTGVDYQMPIVVDIYDRDCNAFWDGFGINFLGESTRCANTARIADVVYHEYAHGITDTQYRPLAPSGAMHEAFSDYYAATITGQPLIGRGFRGPGTFIRTVANSHRWPEDAVGEAHRDGLILGGALWDLRLRLGRARADSLHHFARYGAASTFDDYLLDVLFAADDNANIYDGTPDFDAILEAFRRHGIGDYRVQIQHEPEPDTEDLAKPLRIEATILSIFALEPASVRLHYAAGGGSWTSLAMTPTGAAVREHAAMVPPQASGTRVEYYIAAADTAGNAALLPPGAPAATFQFRVGPDTTPPAIAHAPLADRPIGAATWPLEARVTDNLDRDLASVLVRYSRNSGALDQTLALARAAGHRWKTELPAAGSSRGDSIFYRIVATDSAAAPNVAQAPPTGTHRFRVVQGRRDDLEASDGGLTGGGDWAWIERAPGTAYSGLRLWTTGPSGAYSNDLVSDLETGDLDLGAWSRASLVFQHRHLTEASYDGGRLEASTDGGLAWELLVPNGGYPWTNVEALDGPGYSGSLADWEPGEFDLSRYVGSMLRLRWRFASDSGVTGPGWHLDDIEIVERQVLSVPLALVATSGRDSHVPLRWTPPAGIDPAQAGTPLQGYHVYRASRADLGDAVRLTAAPLAAAQHVDAAAVNGVPYHYAVTAVYAEGESDFSNTSAGQAYVAGYAADVSRLDIAVAGGGAADTAVVFTNTGTGFLQVNAWLGDSDDASIDAVRIAYDLHGGTPGARVAGGTWRRAEALSAFAGGRRLGAPAARVAAAGSGGEWTRLFTDVSESTVPDLRDLWAKEQGGSLLFKIRGYAPWGNLLTDFNIVIGMDADANRSTGDEDGADYYVLMGAFALSQIGAPAVIVTSGRQLVDVPWHQHFPVGADSLEVGFTASILGSGRVHLSVLAFDRMLQVPIDFLPDPPQSAAWMQLQEPFVSVAAGTPARCRIAFPGLVPPGAYAGKIFFDTNDPRLPVVLLPVTYALTTPIEVHDLEAVQEDADVLVRWRAAREADVGAYRVLCARDGGAFEARTPDIEPHSERRYVFRDAAPEPGAYVYRIGAVAPDGGLTLHGHVAIEVTARVPRAAFLDAAMPNPFNPSTTLRYGVARAGRLELAIFDARGRRVRTLRQEARASAGTYRAVWDGRDDSGRRVASGVYHARLRVAGEAFTRRLTLVK